MVPGLYQWLAFGLGAAQADRDQARADKKRIAALARELRRKDKVLAVSAAILV